MLNKPQNLPTFTQKFHNLSFIDKILSNTVIFFKSVTILKLGVTIPSTGIKLVNF